MSLIAFFLLFLQTPSGGDLSLDRAVDLALRQNPAIESAKAGIEAAEASQREARAGRLPSLQVSEAVTDSNNPVFVFGSLLEQARFGPQNFSIPSLNSPGGLTNFRTSAALNLPVFDQGRTSAQIERSNIGKGQADRQKLMTEQQIRFQTIREFYGVVLARERVQVAGDAVRSGESDALRTRDRFKAGLVVESDVLATEVQLADFRQQQIQAQSDLRMAQAAFRTILGAALDSSFEPTGELKGVKFVEHSRDELFRTAMENRPDYQTVKAATEISRIQVREAHDEYLPSLSVFASAGSSGRNPASGSADYAVGAAINLSLFDPKRSAHQDGAKALQSQANAQLHQATAQLQLEIVRAYEDYESARSRTQLSEQAIGEAAEALRIVQDRYETGLTTITEVLRAETALVRARINDSATQYEQIVRYAALLLATGTLGNVQPFM